MEDDGVRKDPCRYVKRCLRTKQDVTGHHGPTSRFYTGVVD